MSAEFIFVGERQSPRGTHVGATWQNRRMAARTLCNALLALGIEPNAQEYCNLWDAPGLGRPAEAPNAATLARLQEAEGIIIAMGQLVQSELRKAGIPHRPMVHPAARGAIRRRDRFIEHVRAVLDPEGGEKENEP